MEKRESALLQALQENAQETERWLQYIKDNEDAVQNLNKFSQHLVVDVMVPVGKKMLVSGQLIHTNEVLVGHFQGYFSKCSASKAKEICNLRIQSGKNHLDKLKLEENLWQNNLEKPYLEGVMPTGIEQEIIEEYDVEREKVWREQHKINIKNQKLNEKQSRNQNESEIKMEHNDNEEDPLKLLEERELLEELENELENLQIDNVCDETVKQLMTGTFTVPNEKKRIAHNISNIKTEAVNNMENSTSLEVQSTDNEAEDEDDKELLAIKEQLKYLSIEEQKTFLEYHIKIMKEKLGGLKLQKMEDVIEKTRLYGLIDELQDLQGLLEEEQSLDEIEIDETSNDNDIEITKPKRRIAFATHNETRLFRKEEKVEELNSNKARDKITLDASIYVKKPTLPVQPTPIIKDKKELIRDRVEKNLQFTFENQSQSELNILDNIMNETDYSIFPFHIPFQHHGDDKTTQFECNNDVPAKPSDFYEQYVKSKKLIANQEGKVVYVNAYKGENEVHVPFLNEAAYEESYEKPLTSISIIPKNVKGILKNKNINIPVELKDDKQKQEHTPTTSKKKDVSVISAYERVVGDVIGKSFSDSDAEENALPDELPKQKFVDTHAPKKRISHFRKMRDAAKATNK